MCTRNLNADVRNRPADQENKDFLFLYQQHLFEESAQYFVTTENRKQEATHTHFRICVVRAEGRTDHQNLR
jgi:hypothetical protein